LSGRSTGKYVVKILIVSQYFWPENFRINDLTQELVSRGHEVTVLTGIPNYPSGKLFDAYKADPQSFGCYEGARILRAPMLVRGQSSVRLILNYLSFALGASLAGLWRLRGQATDVIFVFEPSPVTVGLPAVLLGWQKSSPVVFWALDLWPDTLSAIGAVRSPRILKWVGHLVSFIYNRCTLVLGQSNAFLTNIALYCTDRKKIRYFPSWAEDVFTENEPVPAPEIAKTLGTFNILFAGNLGEAQDLPAVIQAANLLNDQVNVRWLIVGDGRQSKWVRQEVERLGLQDSVLLLGRFPVDRMPSFYAHADALLVSLKKDPVFSMTIPGKVQSYLIAGLPLLGMLDGEGANIIQQANAGLTCPAGDSEGLTEAILALSNMNPDERLQLGMNGQNFAKREFDRSTLITRLESLLQEAIKLHDNKEARV
jgi:glycosyltransferase involved in cell wall biosynthesis